MSFLDQFEVLFSTLKPGVHDFEFVIENSFFEAFENSPIQKGEGKCKVSLDKKENLLTFDFDFDIKVELTCDRSLEQFQFPITAKKQLVVKFGEEAEELGDDIVMINWKDQFFNLAQVIYEYISIEIPMKKVHPKYLTENEDDFGEMIYKTSSDDPDDESDPRWNALKNI